MSEVKPYQLEKDRKFATGRSTYLKGDPVETGRILHVSHISAVFADVQTTEYLEMGYWNGHAYVPLHKDKPAVAGDPVHWNGGVWLREGQYVYALMADVANGELMKLRAEGRWE